MKIKLKHKPYNLYLIIIDSILYIRILYYIEKRKAEVIVIALRYSNFRYILFTEISFVKKNIVAIWDRNQLINSKFSRLIDDENIIVKY